MGGQFDWQKALWGMLSAMALLLLSAPAIPQEIPGRPSAEAGAELAAKVCSNCHLTGDPSQTSAKADVPTFHEIANREQQSADEITARIVLPKHPMPEIQLTRDERGHLAAYIMSLRASEERPAP